MPQKKRPASCHFSAPRKKQRTELQKILCTTPHLLARLNAGLRGLRTLPKCVCETLCLVLVDSLGVAPEVRHEMQDRAVNFVGDALAVEEAAMQQELADAGTAVIQAELKLAEEEADHANLVDDFKASVVATKEAQSLGARAARSELAVLVATLPIRRQNIKEANRKLKMLQHLKRLAHCLEQGPKSEAEVQKKLTVLTTVGNDCGYDNAFLLPVLSTLSKPPNARSAGDANVVSRLHLAIERATAQEESVERSAQTLKIVAAERAEASHAASQRQQQRQATALANAKAIQRDCQRQLKESARKRQHAKLKPALVRCRADDERVASRLAAFCAGPLAAFEILRGVAKKDGAGKASERQPGIV